VEEGEGIRSALSAALFHRLVREREARHVGIHVGVARFFLVNERSFERRHELARERDRRMESRDLSSRSKSASSRCAYATFSWEKAG